MSDRSTFLDFACPVGYQLTGSLDNKGIDFEKGTRNTNFLAFYTCRRLYIRLVERRHPYLESVRIIVKKKNMRKIIAAKFLTIDGVIQNEKNDGDGFKYGGCFFPYADEVTGQSDKILDG